MRSRWLRALALAALAPAAATAFEAVDTIPYPSRGGFPDAYPRERVYPTDLWAQVGILYDSNAFRLNDATDTQAALGKPERSDTVMRYGAGVSHTQRIVGRQSVRLSARGEYYDYLRYHVFDHFAYGLGAEWLWEVTNDLSGIIAYGRTQALADPAEVQRPLKDEITTDSILASAAYRLGPTVRLRGSFLRDSGRREGDRPTLRTDSNTLRIGIDYVTPLANSIGLEARRAEGSAPPGDVLDPTNVFAGNDFDEREIAAVVSYNLGAQLSVSGRLGRTQRDYNLWPAEFDETTGLAVISWRPVPKVTLAFEAYREPRALLETTATHVDVRGVRFGPSWAPTLKLVFSAEFVNERHIVDELTATGISQRDDTVRLLRLAAGWEPRRHITLGAGFQFVERTSNRIERDFDYQQVMLNARYDW